MSSVWDSVWSSRIGLATLAVLLLAASPAGAKVFHSQQEALELAFPAAERVERRTKVLTEAQAKSIQDLSKAPLDSKLSTVHVGWRDGEVIGYALIEVHTVRTLPEALMVVLTPDGRVQSVRVLAFHEPVDYLPPGRWFSQFEDKRLSSKLQLKRGVHSIAGATLSSRAATRAVRRALAYYEVLLDQTKDRAAAN